MPSNEAPPSHTPHPPAGPSGPQAQDCVWSGCSGLATKVLCLHVIAPPEPPRGPTQLLSVPHMCTPYVPHLPQCWGSGISSCWEVCRVMSVPLVRRFLMFSTMQRSLFGVCRWWASWGLQFPLRPSFLKHSWLTCMDRERAGGLGCTSNVPGRLHSMHTLHQPPKCAGISTIRSSILGKKPHLL